MNKIEKQIVDKFIFELENGIFQSNVSKKEYLEYIIKDAKELILYGEYKIALENLLDNLLEDKINNNIETLKILGDIQDEDIKRLLKYFNNNEKIV